MTDSGAKTKIPHYRKVHRILPKFWSNSIGDWSNDYYRIPDVHGLGYKGQKIKVGIIDTGINLKHSAFVKAIQENRLFAYSVIGGDPNDLDGHGTWCASKIIGQDSVAGFAPEIELHVVKALSSDGGTVADFFEAMNLLISLDLNIISTSIAWNPEVYKREVKNMANICKRKNILWFSAAGNDGQNIDGLDNPATDENVISVGSIGKDGKRSIFSDKGANLDLYAPGDGLKGAGLGNNNIVTLRGTSMATPIAAANAALIYEKCINTHGQINFEILKNNLVSCQ